LLIIGDDDYSNDDCCGGFVHLELMYNVSVNGGNWFIITIMLLIMSVMH